MIVMRLRGRLGNQLFIYAHGRALQEKYNCPLILLDNIRDTGGTVISQLQIDERVKIVPYEVGYKYNYYNMKASDYKKINKGFLDLIKKELELRKISKSNKIPCYNLQQVIKSIVYKMKIHGKSEKKRYEYELKHVNQFTKDGLLFCENGYIEFPQSKKENLFCYGYFQSEKYFKNISCLIKKELKPKYEIREELREFINDINNSESVCLSIRMGDYLKNPVLGVCTPQYYQAAIDRIYEIHPDARIFVFSDDIEGVRKQFQFKNEVVFEPNGSSEVEKITYMSMCKHFILSNSSFSWWVQYLGNDPDKIVIAPEKWFATDIPCDIQMKDWIFLPV